MSFFQDLISIQKKRHFAGRYMGAVNEALWVNELPEGGNPRTPWASNPADTSLPDLRDRPSLGYAVTSLRHADRASAMQ